MRFIAAVLGRPVTTVMVLLSVLMVGVIGLSRLPLVFLPEVDIPFIMVQVPVPNSSPDYVERQVVEPVEEALGTLSGLKSLRSTADADGAQFQLEFRWGESLDVVRTKVREKMDLVRPQLPESVVDVAIYSFSTTDIPVVEARVSAGGVDLSANYPLLENHILDRLRRIPGVARVDLGGVEARNVFVDLIHDRIREHRIDVGKLVERLQAGATEMALGRADGGRLRYAVRGLGSLSDLDELGAMPIGVADLRLRDIAEISYEEPPIGVGRHLDQRYAVAISVYKESTANTVEVVDAVFETIEGEIADDPRLDGIELFTWNNQAEQIRAGISGLQIAGSFGALAAVLCLYAFLRRIRTTLIVACAIPFSVLAACGGMYFLGRSLNLLSMMGLMLGVGMLVDNAVVVLEAIDRRNQEIGEPRRAALEGAASVIAAVVAATLTTLIVFLPLILGSANELTTWLGEMGVAISLALAASLVSSLTLIPLAAVRLLGGRVPANAGHPAQRSGRIADGYATALGWILRHKRRASLGLVVVVGCGVLPFALGLVKQDIFAARINDQLRLRYQFDDFRYKGEAEQAVSAVEDYLHAHREEFAIKQVYSYYAENEAGSNLVLARKDLEDEAIKDLRQEIRARLPELPGVKLRFDDDEEQSSGSTSFAVVLRGRDQAVLRGLGDQARERLAEIDVLADLKSSYEHPRKEIEVDVDETRAARRNLQARNVAEAFGFTLGGLRLPRYRDGEREVDTWLALRIEDRAGLDDLKHIGFPVDGGPPIELQSVADFKVIESAREIRHEDRQGVVSISGIYEGEDWEATRSRIEQTMNALAYPGGCSWSWDRRTIERDEQDSQMQVNFLLALILIYLVMAALFESFARPFAILLGILFALPGVAATLAVTGTPMNLMAQIGLLILMGLVVNHGVVFLDRVGQLERSGLPRDEAFVAAGRQRLRPIVMTVATTVVGLAPLALRGSAVGGLFYYPLARVVIGGLISSAALTLFALPVLVAWVEGVAAGWAGLRRASRP